MAYAIWEWAVLGAAIFITAAYHGIFGFIFGSRIGRYQAEVLPVWAYIHEQSCKQSILMIQLMRNLMAIVTGLSAVMVAILMMVVRIQHMERKAELVVVAVITSSALLMYILCASIIATLTMRIALYPTDLSKEIDAKIIAANRLKTRSQLRMLSRHFGYARRLTFVSIQSLFLFIHPVAFLSAAVVSVYFWYYMDTKLGVQMGGMNLSMLSWGVTPKTMADLERVASGTESVSSVPAAAAGAPSVESRNDEREQSASHYPDDIRPSEMRAIPPTA